MADKARDVMTKDPTYVKADDSILDVARQLKSEDSGAVPVCDADGKLVGMVTDRDITLQVVAEGRDPASCTAGELTQAQGEVVTIGADDSIEEALRTMAGAKVRRLPVIDGTDMVGIVAQADLARALPEDKVGELVEAISR